MNPTPEEIHAADELLAGVEKSALEMCQTELNGFITTLEGLMTHLPLKSPSQARDILQRMRNQLIHFQSYEVPQALVRYAPDEE